MYESKINNFNLGQIARSGQCFRIHEETPAEFSIGGKKEAATHKDSFVQTAAEYGNGIRILRQDLWEMVISYLIARCKNITGISKCIETMCKKFGSVVGEYKGKEYYSFPGPDAIVRDEMQQLPDCGLGFRAKDIFNISRLTIEGKFNLEYLGSASYEDGFEYLTSSHYEMVNGKKKNVKNFPGIGPKVANCILLYGLHQVESVPEDVWIKRIREEEYKGERPWWYDSQYAGIIQQWVFYYRRFQ